jgi:ABC-type uncharacterized transport system auxiliary subunit
LVGVALGVFVFGAACISKSYPEKQRYTFEVDRSVAGLPAVSAAPNPEGNGVLRVRRVRVAPMFERKRFVYRTGDNTFVDDFYMEFFAPPGSLLREAVLDWMEPSPVFSSVVRATKAVDADWTLQAEVHQLYVDARDPGAGAPRTILQMDFTLYDAASADVDVVFQKKYSAESSVSAKSGQAIMASWGESLSKVLSELESDIQVSIAE